MGEARAHLLDAVRTYKDRGEDRLTELFAVVLTACPDLTSELFTLCELQPCDRYRVFTQEGRGDGRPDMMIDGFVGDAGVPVAHLWLEDKLDADWQHNQVARYEQAQQELPGRKAVLCVVRYAPPFGARYLRWQRVAELCDRLGHEWCQTTWREEALSGDAPARMSPLR